MTGLAVVLYLLALAGLLLFVVRYSRTDWRRHEMGRHLMVFMTVLAVQCLPAVVAIATTGPASTRLMVLRVVSGAALVAVVWWRAWLLFRRQGDNHHRASVSPASTTGS